MSCNQTPERSQSPGTGPDFSGVAFIYFDLDDTLIDHKTAQDRGLLDLWSQYPQLQDTDPNTFTKVYADVNTRLWKAYRNNEIDQQTLRRCRFEQTFEDLQLKKPDWREVDSAYMACYSRHWEWIDDARQAFVALSEHYPIGIMTNGFTDIQQKKFKHISLNRYSRHLVISEQVGFLKPDPRIFAHSAKIAEMDPSQLLYVGDSYSSDILGGSKSGWRTAWYQSNGRDEGNGVADYSFSHFSQLVDVLIS